MARASRTQPQVLELDDAEAFVVVVVVVEGCDVVVLGRVLVVVVAGAVVVVVGAEVVVTGVVVVVVAEAVVVVTDAAVVVVVAGWPEALASNRPKLSGAAAQAIRMAAGLQGFPSMGGSLR